MHNAAILDAYLDITVVTEALLLMVGPVVFTFSPKASSTLNADQTRKNDNSGPDYLKSKWLTVRTGIRVNSQSGSQSHYGKVTPRKSEVEYLSFECLFPEA
jgi:hypothetical protein